MSQTPEFPKLWSNPITANKYISQQISHCPWKKHDPLTQPTGCKLVRSPSCTYIDDSPVSRNSRHLQPCIGCRNPKPWCQRPDLHLSEISPTSSIEEKHGDFHPWEWPVIILDCWHPKLKGMILNKHFQLFHVFPSRVILNELSFEWNQRSLELKLG